MIMTKVNSKKIDFLRVNSETKNLKKVRNFIKQYSIENGFDEQSADEIVIAVDEACTNIIKHGLKYNKEEKLEIRVYIESNYFAIDIVDNSPSFDLRDFKNIELDSHLSEYKNNGLGIFMIKSYVDLIEYKRYENGSVKNTLTLKKHLPT